MTVDVHWSFITYLAGMFALGHAPGIDFVSTHGIVAPILQGFFMRMFGVSQVSLCLITAMFIYIQLIFIYKTGRLVLNSGWSLLTTAILTCSYTGREVPWFNDILMLVVTATIYMLLM